MPLAPFDVWIGGFAGDVSSPHARRCAGPIDTEPDYKGEAMVVECTGRGLYVFSAVYVLVVC
jgi:hypothetical protein